MDDKNKKGDLLNYFDACTMMLEAGFHKCAERHAVRIKDFDD